jgi:hypothetical protein
VIFSCARDGDAEATNRPAATPVIRRPKLICLLPWTAFTGAAS